MGQMMVVPSNSQPLDFRLLAAMREEKRDRAERARMGQQNMMAEIMRQKDQSPELLALLQLLMQKKSTEESNQLAVLLEQLRGAREERHWGVEASKEEKDRAFQRELVGMSTAATERHLGVEQSEGALERASREKLADKATAATDKLAGLQEKQYEWTKTEAEKAQQEGERERVVSRYGILGAKQVSAAERKMDVDLRREALEKGSTFRKAGEGAFRIFKSTHEDLANKKDGGWTEGEVAELSKRIAGFDDEYRKAMSTLKTLPEAQAFTYAFIQHLDALATEIYKLPIKNNGGLFGDPGKIRKPAVETLGLLRELTTKKIGGLSRSPVDLEEDLERNKLDMQSALLTALEKDPLQEGASYVRTQKLPAAQAETYLGNILRGGLNLPASKIGDIPLDAESQKKYEEYMFELPKLLQAAFQGQASGASGQQAGQTFWDSFTKSPLQGGPTQAAPLPALPNPRTLQERQKAQYMGTLYGTGCGL